MADGARQHHWTLTSSLMALQAEINRDRRRRRKPFRPDDFNPYVVNRPIPAKASVEQAAKLLRAKYYPKEINCGKAEVEN
ncbi:hypothetical protein Poly41_21440 [Novipirellula artificiosorum]|uniref:Uncharacterized protein n=1 Tax=Novipirellula artificiosorum TaxID=2528016 RepID=A0A5C6DR51_9BACT|nr:hypothetical protein Poly41_21440 [Novipirellula artificiosorum]